ncbi:hypothetical protein NTGZN8_170047 [Candidatus Nitrotoga fabula]|uniref:Uncharacterized protein n=1 Tax=Candidatus Nitrotoga fabula TaxID=2182327 RepID=A0A916FBK7_9PROT|nr:hypothetical protein NTGZN8_170047 [Candidatus Nitrotoga fabula]
MDGIGVAAIILYDLESLRLKDSMSESEGIACPWGMAGGMVPYWKDGGMCDVWRGVL